jgi:hypothetical protein
MATSTFRDEVNGWSELIVTFAFQTRSTGVTMDGDELPPLREFISTTIQQPEFKIVAKNTKRSRHGSERLRKS